MDNMMYNDIFIILPVYNGEKFFLQQLMSIYFQDYDNWHLIIINDGSTDSTEYIINNFISNYGLENKVTVISQSNKGLNKSIEKGLIVAKKIIELSGNRNAYITYCDADDIMMTNRLSYQIDFMKKNKNCDLSYHDLVLIDENNRILNLSFLKKLNGGPLVNVCCDRLYEYGLCNHMPSTTIMFKADLIDLLLPFPNDYPPQDRWTSLVFLGNNCTIERIGIALGFYRRYKNQMSDSSGKKIDYSKRFNDFSLSLEMLNNRITDKERKKEITTYTNFYKDRSLWVREGVSRFKQLLYVLLYHPKILLYKLLSYIKN